MPGRSDLCAMAVMAKAPQAGRSKTRLVPYLTPEQAAMLSAAFLRDVTENVALAGRRCPIQGFIAYAPAGLEAHFAGHLAAGTGLVLADGQLDMSSGVQGFGRCLFQAMRSLLAAGYGSTVLLNADSPTLPTALLRRAADLLSYPGHRVVLGPADDGGYYLLGAKQPHAHLFEDIAWSTADVAEQTRARAHALGLELIELETWYDVDDVASLHRLATEIENEGRASLERYHAAKTAACVARLGLREILAATP